MIRNVCGYLFLSVFVCVLPPDHIRRAAYTGSGSIVAHIDPLHALMLPSLP